MITEKVFEDIICKYPELIEEGLIFNARQVRVCGKIMDVLFEDRFKDKLIVELKVGPVDRQHVGQVMEYEGGVLNIEEPTARIMLIGNRVPPNLQKALDHHGIEWREISFSYLKEFLRKKNDIEMLGLFEKQDISSNIARNSIGPGRPSAGVSVYATALAIAKLESPRYIYCKEEQTFYKYSDGVYSPLDDLTVLLELNNVCPRQDITFTGLSMPNQKKILENLKNILKRSWQDFNKDEGVINFRNCLYRIDSGERLDHTPEVISITRLPYDFDEKAVCPLWQKTLAEIFQNDQDKIQTLQEFFGCCLVPDSHFQKALLLVGESFTGKSTILNALEHMIGSDNYSVVKFNYFRTPYYLATMVHKLVNIIHNVSGKDAKKFEKFETEFKIIVSGQEIVSKQKYRKPLEFRPYCKFAMAMDKIPPAFKSLSNYFLIITCERVFAPHEENYSLKDQLLTELPGILNWALEGLKRLRERGGFFRDAYMKEHIEEMRLQNNPVAAWAKENIRIEMGAELLKGEAYQKYDVWCGLNGYKKIGLNRFSGEIFRIFSKSTKRNIRQSLGERKCIWPNLTWNTLEPTLAKE
jgi:P4 family phage/plasmid primase-like protien